MTIDINELKDITQKAQDQLLAEEIKKNKDKAERVKILIKTRCLNAAKAGNNNASIYQLLRKDFDRPIDGSDTEQYLIRHLKDNSVGKIVFDYCTENNLRPYIQTGMGGYGYEWHIRVRW